MNLTVYIIDDEAHAVETLRAYVEKTAGLTIVGTATDPVQALPDLTGGQSPDILLLDVDMRGISGLELARLISSHTSVIFVTSYREYGVEAFEISAVDYLLKPIAYARFYNAIQKVKEQRGHLVKERASFFVKGDVKEKYVKVVAESIVYIAAAQNYVTIHLTGEQVMTYLTLAEVNDELSPIEFCQIHRSFIISRNRIKAIEKGQVLMENNQLVPIGKSYEDKFFNWLTPSFVISKRLSGR